jgi:hypothetical protein
MKEKLRKDIFERIKDKNLGYLPSTGKSEQLYDFRYCQSGLSELKGYYFVVAKFLRYHGNSMEDFGYNVFVYDKDGNYVDDSKIKDKCKGKFFSTLIDLK